MKLRCPIDLRYINARRSVILNQLFAENKNRLFYGPEGHRGIDFRTKGRYRWMYDKITKTRRFDRTTPEQAGLIPIVAAHDGFLTVGFNNNAKEGIYMRIRTEDALYQTLYFHLDKLRVWKNDERMTGWERIKGRDFVKAGTVIGWGGNTGRFTTGAHLHFALDEKQGGKYVRVDPLPYFQDDLLYVRYYGMGFVSRKFRNGIEIT